MNTQPQLQQPQTQDISPDDIRQTDDIQQTQGQLGEAALTSVIQTPASLQNKYLFMKELGHGAQAKIFLALRLKDQQAVSIKQLNIGSVKTWKEYDLFQREAKVLATINMPGVAKFYEAIDCLEDDPPASYIVQEFIEGASLAQMLKAGHRFKVSEIYDIIIQLLTILSQLHGMTPPVIHRDIKPSNIMITPQKNGSYKVTLIDFGAVANPQVQSGGSTVAGTFGYMPPEQLMGHPEPASDLYALAAVTIELFTGKSPAVLPQKDFRLIFEPDMEQYPPVLSNILRQMLEPKTENRLKDIQYIIDTFKQFKANKFNLKNIKDSDIDHNKPLNEKINAIQSIGEDGNMEIWQGLSDATPRAIPDAILTYFSNVNKHTESTSADTDMLDYLIDPNDQNMGILIRVCTISISFFTLFMALVCIKENLLFGFTFFALFFLFLIITIRSFMNIQSDNSHNHAYRFSDNTNNYKASIEDMFNLVKNGRKTVATITDVKYIELSDKDVSKQNGIYLCDIPSFSISYKFNPPDDSKSEDLIHECIVHTAPENHYKVGDPLPILYTLDKQFFGETILSIPFPFPLAEFNMNDLIHTQQNRLYKDISNDQKSIQNTYEYQEHLQPIIKSLNHPSLLAKELKAHAWLIDNECLPALLNIASQLLRQKDESVHFALMSSLSSSIHYSQKKASQTICNFIIDYLKQPPESITVGAIEGLFNTNNTSYCDFSEELTHTIFKLYKDPDIPITLKSTIENKLRIPLSQAGLLFQSPELTPLYAQFFAGWHCKLGNPADGFQTQHHKAMALYYQTCMGKNHEVDKLVFDKIWANVYFWSKIPNDFWNVYFEVYEKAYPELQKHMRRLPSLSKEQVPPDVFIRLKAIRT